MTAERTVPGAGGRRHLRGPVIERRARTAADARLSKMGRRRHRDDDPDQTLLQAAHGGDHRAMAVLAGRYRTMIEAWVRRRIADPSLVDDVFSRVILRVWQKGDQYDPDRGTMAAWVSVLTRTAFLDALRERRRTPTPVADTDVEVGIDDESEQVVTAAVLRELQGRLSAEHQEVIRLVFVERSTMTEAARQLGLPVGTVKSRCFYALRALRLHAEELGLSAG